MKRYPRPTPNVFETCQLTFAFASQVKSQPTPKPPIPPRTMAENFSERGKASRAPTIGSTQSTLPFSVVVPRSVRSSTARPSERVAQAGEGLERPARIATSRFPRRATGRTSSSATAWPFSPVPVPAETHVDDVGHHGPLRRLAAIAEEERHLEVLEDAVRR